MHFVSDALEPTRSVVAEPPSPDAGSSQMAASAAVDPLQAQAVAAPEPGAPSESETEDRDLGDLPPLDDPYLHAPMAPPPAKLSKLAITSIIAPFVPVPLGAIAGIVFGWSARRAIEASGGRRQGYGLATVGLLLGLVTTLLWGALLSFGLWTSRYRAEGKTAQAAEPAKLTEPGRARVPPGAVPPGAAPPQPAAPEPTKPSFVIPKTTTSRREGAISIVDVGASATSLKEALAKERAAAASAGETMLMMTTGARCEPCKGFDRSLGDPLVQTALSRIRLVRVDIGFFKEDLESLKVPTSRIPGFYLLALDLTPRDGIDGGEWDEDIARNIAPVVGAFVRGKYTARREAWKPLPGSGVRL
jgi:hypothetical protein